MRVFFFQAEDGIRDLTVTGVQTCALPILMLVGLVLASMDWFGGGLRLWVCTRYVHPGVRLRDMVLAGGVRGGGAHLTPFPSGSAPMSVWGVKRARVPGPGALRPLFVTVFAAGGGFPVAGP